MVLIVFTSMKYQTGVVKLRFRFIQKKVRIYLTAIRYFFFLKVIKICIVYCGHLLSIVKQSKNDSRMRDLYCRCCTVITGWAGFMLFYINSESDFLSECLSIHPSLVACVFSTHKVQVIPKAKGSGWLHCYHATNLLRW